MKDESLELIRHIAAECGLALDRSDPVVVVQVATQLIVRKALEASEQASAEQLVRHRQELEAIAAKWNADAKHAATIITKEAAHAIAAAVAREHGEAFRIGAAHLATSLAANRASLRRALKLCCACTLAAIAVCIAIGFALARFR